MKVSNMPSQQPKQWWHPIFRKPLIFMRNDSEHSNSFLSLNTWVLLLRNHLALIEVYFEPSSRFYKSIYFRRVNALTVSSLLLIYPRSLLDSPSLNPFVKPLMEVIRFEENITFAQYALNSIPILFRIASGKKLFLQITFFIMIIQFLLP